MWRNSCRLRSHKPRVFCDLDYTVGELQKVGNATCNMLCPETLWIWLVEFCKKKKKDATWFCEHLCAFSDDEEKQKYTEGHNPICDLLRESPLETPNRISYPLGRQIQFSLRALSVLIEEDSKVIIFGGGLLLAGQDTCFLFQYQLHKSCQTCYCFTQLLLLNEVTLS
jgi:hypothetical protein